MEKSKILILSPSPQRDKVVDDLIAEELQAMGNEVWVKPCLREGREWTLKVQPDIVVLPPIRNAYSRDVVETLKRWGCAVVSRHTEASCAWEDFKNFDPAKKQSILGHYPYNIDVEIVWSEDEAQILRRRGSQFPIVAVGSFALDIYHKENFRDRFMSRENFYAKYKFDPNKKTLLIGAPWGFADNAPDLRIEEVDECKSGGQCSFCGQLDNEAACRARHIDMIKRVQAALDWNILFRPHPGVLTKPYTDALRGITMDTETPCTELLVNVDALIHSGSTMAMEAHCLNIPAFQYGDVNEPHKRNWMISPKNPLSRISPMCEIPELIKGIQGAEGTNANTDTLDELEKGRYGKMDGLATKRAAEIIGKLKGKFKYTWPKAHRDYDQILAIKHQEKIMRPITCGICKENYFMMNPKWLQDMVAALGYNPKLIIERMPQFQKALHCPHCGTQVTVG